MVILVVKNLWKELCTKCGVQCSGVDSGGAGGARAPPDFEGPEKGQSLTSVFLSLVIKASTPGFEKLSMALWGCWSSEKGQSLISAFRSIANKVA